MEQRVVIQNYDLRRILMNRKKELKPRIFFVEVVFELSCIAVLLAASQLSRSLRWYMNLHRTKKLVLTIELISTNTA